jgi:hypothetical protein
MSEKKSLEFKLGESLDALPERHYAKGSKYDVILGSTFSKRYTEIQIGELEANYIRTQLVKRIKALKLVNLGVAVSNGKCYIEKESTVKSTKPKA